MCAHMHISNTSFGIYFMQKKIHSSRSHTDRLTCMLIHTCCIVAPLLQGSKMLFFPRALTFQNQNVCVEKRGKIYSIDHRLQQYKCM
jgi:hypothetical protein